MSANAESVNAESANSESANANASQSAAIGQSSRDAASIHAQTQPGRLALTVADLERSVAFYTNNLGLTLRAEAGDSVVLGTETRELVHLHHVPDLKPWPGRGYAGLFHFALLFPTRLGLADALRRLAETNYQLDGASDHGVSEALYLRDPDGHGIELYRDRPRSQWPFAEGQLQMVTEALDLYDILGELNRTTPDWTGAQPGTRIGHVHIHNGDLNAALAFYGDSLGLALMQRFGGQALFLAAGGYHHHLGVNLWAGANVPLPPDDVAQMLWYALEVPGGLDVVVEQLQGDGHTLEAVSGGWAVRDPSGVEVRLVQAETE